MHAHGNAARQFGSHNAVAATVPAVNILWLKATRLWQIVGDSDELATLLVDAPSVQLAVRTESRSGYVCAVSRLLHATAILAA